jgi:hypothetical protein
MRLSSYAFDPHPDVMVNERHPKALGKADTLGSWDSGKKLFDPDGALLSSCVLIV